MEERVKFIFISTPPICLRMYQAACLFSVLFISVYLSSLPVAHLSDAAEDVKLSRGIVQEYRTKLLRAPPSSLTSSVYSTSHETSV